MQYKTHKMPEPRTKKQSKLRQQKRTHLPMEVQRPHTSMATTKTSYTTLAKTLT